MAHFILEYSHNLQLTDQSVQNLFLKIHEAAVDTGLFPLKGLRSRAYPSSQYRVADGNPNHGFAHLEIKLGAGRSLEERKIAAEVFFDILCNHFSDQICQRGLALSFEMKELEPVLKFNKNNVQEFL